MTSTATRRKQDPWKSARTLADLGNLTARWLEGELPDVPGYDGPPDEETLPLVPVLATLNRAGYVTICSQPGETGPGYDGALWEQRAAVEGFADDTLVLRLIIAAAAAGLAVIHHNPARRARRWTRCGQMLPVTRRNGKDYTWFGAHPSRLNLSDDWTGYGSCHPDAVDAVLNAWQVTVIDPEWGRNDLLWEVLSSV